MNKRMFFVALLIIVGVIISVRLFKKPAVSQTSVVLPIKVEMTSVTAEEKAQKIEFQKGVTYVAWTKDGYHNENSVESMKRLVSLGVQWACVVSTWYLDRPDSTKIYPINDKSPSDESIIFAIDKLHDAGIKVMFKPHIDIVTSDGKWRGEIGPGTDSDWQAWFDSYRDFVLHYARIAQEKNVELFCIGTELSNTTVTKPALWRELIKSVREVYKGPLTYAANWYEEFSYVEFWDALDYAGIDPYFPLVCSSRPTKEELIEVWKDWVDMIEVWQKQINKPVLITEIGYKSSVGAADEPWEHSPIGEVDLELQANCYEALLESFWDKPWFYGVYWWYWGVSPKIGGQFHRGFVPQNKPAEKVIEKWYKDKPVSEKAY